MVALVNATAGNMSGKYEYGPFGQTTRLPDDFAPDQPNGFGTQLANELLGVAKFLHRDYHWGWAGKSTHRGETMTYAGWEAFLTDAYWDEVGKPPAGPMLGFNGILQFLDVARIARTTFDRRLLSGFSIYIRL